MDFMWMNTFETHNKQFDQCQSGKEQKYKSWTTSNDDGIILTLTRYPTIENGWSLHKCPAIDQPKPICI